MKLTRRATFRSLVGATAALVASRFGGAEAKELGPTSPIIAEVFNAGPFYGERTDEERRQEAVVDQVREQPWFQEMLKQRVMEQMYPPMVRYAPTDPLQPEYIKALPVLYGNGVHDDTPAMQAMMNGEPYYDLRNGMAIPALAEQQAGYSINQRMDAGTYTPAAFDLKIDGKPYVLGKSRDRDYTARTITKASDDV